MKKIRLFIVFSCFTICSASYVPGLTNHTHLEMHESKAGREATGASQIPPRTLPDDAYDFQATGCIFDGFDSFAKSYFALCSVLGKPKDFYTWTHNALTNAHKRGINLFEFIVSPDLAIQYDIDWKQMLHEIDAAVAMTKHECPLKAGALLTFIKGTAPTQGDKATEQINYLIQEQTKGRLKSFVGVHLSGPEVNNEDITQFIPAYDIARAAKLGLAAHAGEWGGPENIRGVLRDLKVTRIGHGIRAIEDPSVIKQLAETRVLLEGCPSSNICTGALASRRYIDLPFKELFNQGVQLYACNPDDSVLFNDTTEAAEAYKLKQNLGFSDHELQAMERMGIVASFVSDKDKEYALKKLTASEQAAAKLYSE